MMAKTKAEMKAKAFRDELFAYVGFGDEDAAALARAQPLVEGHFGEVVEAFYDQIKKNPAALSVFRDEAQIERQKGFLLAWLQSLFGGVYDEAFVERHMRIGRTHVRIRLDQRYMFSAMNVVRRGLHEALIFETLDHDPPRWTVGEVLITHHAIDRICDLELAIMLESYRESYDEQLILQQRLATIGQLAASIGHELRNPLAVIETSAHLLKRRVHDQDKALRHVDRIEAQVGLCNSIITDLLELARNRRPEIQPRDLREILEQALSQVPLREGESVEVSLPELPPVQVDGGQIRQVLVNLLTNAAQAVRSQSGGHVRLRFLREGHALRIEVEDDGPGISEEAMHRLFEPLFTTKSKGIGLGLPLCRQLVEKHGGSIEGHNRPEGGALFSVLLPEAFARAE